MKLKIIYKRGNLILSYLLAGHWQPLTTKVVMVFFWHFRKLMSYWSGSSLRDKLILFGAILLNMIMVIYESLLYTLQVGNLSILKTMLSCYFSSFNSGDKKVINYRYRILSQTKLDFVLAYFFFKLDRVAQF